ncbi:hypothetical protein [Sulfurisphaera ohwakuensis]|uniref:hypothetical protein n=1 Tax=Sulfurisphaera ohwakuensis TaxID=69656 RepID=UPI0036F3BA8D
MAVSDIIKENEKLRTELQRYRDLVERLERKIEKLEKENKEYKKKYQTLVDIIVRVMQLSEQYKDVSLEEIIEELRRKSVELQR